MLRPETFRLVVVESPYSNGNAIGLTREQTPASVLERNLAYARACMHDCLLKGEAPIANHLLYTQPGVLDDGLPHERELGISAGLAWALNAQAAVFYTDLGWSRGMTEAKQFYIRLTGGRGPVIEERTLPDDVLQKLLE